jgi:hypothetical protein
MYDLFISFAHIDNEEERWVERFHEALQAALNKFLGRRTNVWRDPRLAGNDVLRSEIESAVAQSALLVAVLSESYFASKWCADELRMFRKAAAQTGGLQLGTKLRVFKVTKMPVHRDLPDLPESIGYVFHYLEAGTPFELEPGTLEFKRVLNKLAWDMKSTLAMMPQIGGAIRPVAEPTGVTVFLAETTSDLANDYDSLRSELELNGHEVVTARGLPYSARYPDPVREQLARARLAIHPIGTEYGLFPERADRSIVEIQYELSAEEAARRSDFDRVVWMSPERRTFWKELREPYEGRGPAFFQRLQDDPELRVTVLENLKTEVQRILVPPPPFASAEQPSHEGELARVSVYLIYEPSESDEMPADASAIDQWLFGQGFDVYYPPSDGDEAERRALHEDHLAKRDGVVIYHGPTDEKWLLAKTADVQKASYARAHPFRAQAIVVADPRTAAKQRFRLHGFEKIEMFGGFEASAFDHLASRLRSALEGVA